MLQRVNSTLGKTGAAKQNTAASESETKRKIIWWYYSYSYLLTLFIYPIINLVTLPGVHTALACAECQGD
jgi:hypothetical protein